MPEDSYNFSSTRARLDDIVSQVRKKDTSLEKSLDLLEEGVRLANQCTELIDHADWEAAGAPSGGVAAVADAEPEPPTDAADDSPADEAPAEEADVEASDADSSHEDDADDADDEAR